MGVRGRPGTRGSPVASLPGVFTGCARVSAFCAGVAATLGTATLVSVIRVSLSRYESSPFIVWGLINKLLLNRGSCTSSQLIN